MSPLESVCLGYRAGLPAELPSEPGPSQSPQQPPLCRGRARHLDSCEQVWLVYRAPATERSGAQSSGIYSPTFSNDHPSLRFWRRVHPISWQARYPQHPLFSAHKATNRVFRPDLSKKEGTVFSSGQEDTRFFHQIPAGGFQFLLGWTRFYAGTSMSERNRGMANLPPSLSRNPKPTRTPAKPQGSGRLLDFGEAVAYPPNQLPPLSPAPESWLDHHV